MQANEAVTHFSNYRRVGADLLDRLRATQQRIVVSVTHVDSELDDARTALAVAYLPTLDPEALTRAEKLSGFRGFSRRKPLDAMAHELRVLQSTVARIVGLESFRRREFLVGPHGELTREVAERQSMLEPWQLECAHFEDLPGFLKLIELKYDTPDFVESWYQASYWKHWSQGDAVCVALKLDDFGDDVLPAYEEVRVPRDQWRAQLQEAQGKIDAVHAMVQRHDQAVTRIPRLPELYLEQAQLQLAEFLAHADPSLLNDWLTEDGSDRAVLMVLRRLAGLKAKREVLEEMRTQGVQAQITALEARSAKHSRKVAKYRRSKHQYATLTARDTDPKFGPKAKKMKADLKKLETQIHRIERYDDYGQFDLEQDPELWYIAFTRKRPSKFSPRLRTWYTAHPDASPTLDPLFDDEEEEDDDDGASTAVGIASGFIDRHDAGYLS